MCSQTANSHTSWNCASRRRAPYQRVSRRAAAARRAIPPVMATSKCSRTRNRTARSRASSVSVSASVPLSPCTRCVPRRARPCTQPQRLHSPRSYRRPCRLPCRPPASWSPLRLYILPCHHRHRLRCLRSGRTDERSSGPTRRTR